MSSNYGEYLTPREASELLRIGRANFWAKVREGKLPPAAIRIGRLTRWSRKELLYAAEDQRNNFARQTKHTNP
jgi:excisionase family DNA binding protein